MGDILLEAVLQQRRPVQLHPLPPVRCVPCTRRCAAASCDPAMCRYYVIKNELEPATFNFQARLRPPLLSASAPSCSRAGWPSSGKCGAVGVIEIAQALACRSAWVPQRSPVRQWYRRANASIAPTVLSIAESTLSSGCEGGPDPRRHSPHCAREACGGLVLLFSPAKPVVTAPAAVRAPTCRAVHRGAGRRCSAGCRSW